MGKVKGIILNGEWLGSNVVINEMFNVIYSISPVIMLEFIHIVNDIEKLENAIQINNFNYNKKNVIDIEFSNHELNGLASLLFEMKDGKAKLLNSFLKVNRGDDKLEQKVIKPAISQNHESEEIALLKEIREKLSATLPINKSIEKISSIDDEPIDYNESNDYNEDVCDNNVIENSYEDVYDNNVVENSYEDVCDNNVIENSYEDVCDNNVIENSHEDVYDNNVVENSYEDVYDNNVVENSHEDVYDNNVIEDSFEDVCDNNVIENSYEDVYDNDVVENSYEDDKFNDDGNEYNSFDDEFSDNDYLTEVDSAEFIQNVDDAYQAATDEENTNESGYEGYKKHKLIEQNKLEKLNSDTSDDSTSEKDSETVLDSSDSDFSKTNESNVNKELPKNDTQSAKLKQRNQSESRHSQMGVHSSRRSRNDDNQEKSSSRGALHSATPQNKTENNLEKENDTRIQRRSSEQPLRDAKNDISKKLSNKEILIKIENAEINVNQGPGVGGANFNSAQMNIITKDNQFAGQIPYNNSGFQNYGQAVPVQGVQNIGQSNMQIGNGIASDTPVNGINVANGIQSQGGFSNDSNMPMRGMPQSFVNPQEQLAMLNQIQSLKDELQTLQQQNQIVKDLQSQGNHRMTLEEYLEKQRRIKEEKQAQYNETFKIIGSNKRRVQADMLDGGVFVAGEKIYKWGEKITLNK